MVPEIYRAGQQAYERGESFLTGNPYRCNDDRHYDWSAGWFERMRHYDNLSHEAYIKEQEAEQIEITKEREAKENKKKTLNIIRKFKNSKKGKAEAAGQTTLFS